MNVQRTRVIMGTLAFALVAGALIDSASGQLFRRNRRNAACCAPVTTCCTNYSHNGYNSYQPTYATSNSSGYGMASGYVSTGVRGAGCGSTIMGNQVQTQDGNRSNSDSTFAAPGSSSSQQYSSQSSQNQTYKPAIPGTNPDYRSDADRQQQSGEFRNDPQFNQNGTIRSNTDQNLNRDSTNQGNTDLNLDGSLRNNTDLNLNRDGTNRSGTDLNLDGSIRGNTDLNRDNANQGNTDLKLDGSIRNNTDLNPNKDQ